MPRGRWCGRHGDCAAVRGALPTPKAFGHRPAVYRSWRCRAGPSSCHTRRDRAGHPGRRVPRPRWWAQVLLAEKFLGPAAARWAVAGDAMAALTPTASPISSPAAARPRKLRPVGRGHPSPCWPWPPAPSSTRPFLAAAPRRGPTCWRPIAGTSASHAWGHSDARGGLRGALKEAAMPVTPACSCLTTGTVRDADATRAMPAPSTRPGTPRRPAGRLVWKQRARLRHHHPGDHGGGAGPPRRRWPRRPAVADLPFAGAYSGRPSRPWLNAWLVKRGPTP